MTPQSPVLTPTSAPAIVKRIGEYDPATGAYPAYVAIDGELEQCIGSRWTQGDADRMCDEFIFNYFVDHHTPEKAAQIAAAAFEPTTIEEAVRLARAMRHIPLEDEEQESEFYAAAQPPACSIPDCTRPATRPGLLGGMPMCDECDAAGLERLRRAVFEGA